MPPLMKLMQSRLWQLRCGNEIELAAGSRLVEGYRHPELDDGRITPGRITPGIYSCITRELATIHPELQNCRDELSGHRPPGASRLSRRLYRWWFTAYPSLTQIQTCSGCFPGRRFGIGRGSDKPGGTPSKARYGSHLRLLLKALRRDACLMSRDLRGMAPWDDGKIACMIVNALCIRHLSRPIILFLLIAPAHAQSSNGSRNAFEVASVRPATGQEAGGEGGSRSEIQYAADSLTMRNIDLPEMVEWAYGLEHYQLAGQSMLEGRRYDVRARTGASTDVDSLRLMLQDLLATRFRVELHHEKKRTSVYQLVVAKDGPRLPADKTDSLPPSYPKETLPRVVDGGFVFTNVSMTDFAKQLTELRGIDLPGLDHTGIRGVYDITLKSAARALLEPDGPSLLTLIHE
jgi:uncharacterized protein (TIGR03435 family)